MKKRLVIIMTVSVVIVVTIAVVVRIKPENNSTKGSEIQKINSSKSVKAKVETSGLAIVYFTRQLSIAETAGLFRDAEISADAYTIHAENYGATVELSKAGVDSTSALQKILANNRLVSEVVDVLVPAK